MSNYRQLSDDMARQVLATFREGRNVMAIADLKAAAAANVTMRGKALLSFWTNLEQAITLDAAGAKGSYGRLTRPGHEALLETTIKAAANALNDTIVSVYPLTYDALLAGDPLPA